VKASGQLPASADILVALAHPAFTVVAMSPENQ
jgi:hypothetical protein